MENKIEVEFANGEKTQVISMDSEIFKALQELYKSAIVKIEGQPSAFWGMSDGKIETKAMDWIEITEENKPEGVILGFNKKWICEDFNPKGVRLCHWCDLSGWVSSYWNNYHECYDTRLSEEDNDMYKLSKGEDQVPTHYCNLPTCYG